MNGNFARVRHHLVVAIHIRRAEVYEDVDDEGDVDCKTQKSREYTACSGRYRERNVN